MNAHAYFVESTVNPKTKANPCSDAAHKKPSMTPSSLPFTRTLRASTLAVIGLLVAFPLSSQAKDKDKDKHKSHKSGHDNSHHDDHDRQVYASRPRSSFVLSLGTGYAGRGYYYGPPDCPYYYERSDVRYYATRESAPREYYSRESYRGDSSGVAVQRALARQGYYQGSFDGDIGPQSRRAIARYQQDRGLQVTGTITSSLLRSLGI